MTFQEIQRKVGYENHATVIYADKKVEDMLSIQDVYYVDVMANWADVFDEMNIPRARQDAELMTRIDSVIQSSLTSGESIVTVLENLKNQYKTVIN